MYEGDILDFASPSLLTVAIIFHDCSRRKTDSLVVLTHVHVPGTRNDDGKQKQDENSSKNTRETVSTTPTTRRRTAFQTDDVTQRLNGSVPTRRAVGRSIGRLIAGKLQTRR